MSDPRVWKRAMEPWNCGWDGHLSVDWSATGDFNVRQQTEPVPTVPIPAHWCLWCGAAVYDPDQVSEETTT